MQKWEYLFVIGGDGSSYRNLVQFVNGVEVPNWKKGEDISAYANKMGDEGWELISTPFTSDQFNFVKMRLIFKRPKP